MIMTCSAVYKTAIKRMDHTQKGRLTNNIILKSLFNISSMDISQEENKQSSKV